MSFLPGLRPGPADLRRAQSDPEARNLLIERFTPFVLRVSTKTVGRYLRLGEDDEVSIALIAFNEAIDRFDPDRGAHFLPFAETVIKRRLIDHFRRESQHREVPLSSISGDDPESRLQVMREAEAAIALHQEMREKEERIEEIERYRAELSMYGIALEQLAASAPRHRDARESALNAARIVAQTELYEHLSQRRTLPMRALSERVDLSRKTLERHRKYIVAVAVALAGDYPHLRQYFHMGGDD